MINYSMNKNERIPFALLYGLREDEILKETTKMAEENILPKSKNEIFRRGLHACRYLAEVDEEFLLTLLSQTLHKLSKYYLPLGLKLSKDLALAIYATKISKHGSENAETFGTVINTIQTFEEITKNNINADQEVILCQQIGKLAISVDTIFLEPKIKKDGGMSMYLGSIFNLLLASELEATGIDISKSKKSQKRTTKSKRIVRSFSKGSQSRKAIKV